MTRMLVFAAAVLTFAGAMPSRAAAQGHADDAAITKVVMAETDRFFARDYEGWASLFVQVPNTTQVWNNPDGSYTHRQGWDTISARIREFMQKNPKPDTTPMWRENVMIRHYGNAAFVTFDKYLGDRKTAKPIREIRVVERLYRWPDFEIVKADFEYREIGPQTIEFRPVIKAGGSLTLRYTVRFRYFGSGV